MRRATRLLVAAVAAAAGFVAFFGSPAPAPAAEGARVLMVDNEPDLTAWHFEPAEVTVPAGATVVWFNKGKEDHTVTADDKAFDSGMKKSGTSWQRTFPKVGRYTYHCAPHPWMTGTVRVLGATAAGAPAGVTTSAPPTTVPAAAPPAAATPTTFPSSLGVQRPDAPAAPETTAAPPSPPAPAPTPSDDAVAAPASNQRDSGSNLLGTTAVVVLPTLAALGIGSRLRRRSKPAEA